MIAMLKMRFQCLDRSAGALKYNPPRVSHIVIICCALHNLALQQRVELPEEELEEWHISSTEEDVEGNEAEELLKGADVSHEAMPMSRLGRQARDVLIDARLTVHSLCDKASVMGTWQLSIVPTLQEDDDNLQWGQYIDPHRSSVNI